MWGHQFEEDSLYPPSERSGYTVRQSGWATGSNSTRAMRTSMKHSARLTYIVLLLVLQLDLTEYVVSQ